MSDVIEFTPRPPDSYVLEIPRAGTLSLQDLMSLVSQWQVFLDRSEGGCAGVFLNVRLHIEPVILDGYGEE